MKKLFLYSAVPLIAGLLPNARAGDLLAWWSFDTTGSGLSIDAYAGNVGVLLNGAQYSTPGTGRTGGGTDRAMQFGNDRHRMYVPDASFLNPAGAANAISISFWQNLTAVRNQTNFFANSPGVTRSFSTHAPYGDSTIYWDTGANCCGADQRISVNPGTTWLSSWNHVVLVKNGDTKRIYVNGAEVTSGTNIQPLPTTFTDLFVGNSSNLAEAVDGLMDDVAFFKRELTPAEVTALAGGASPVTLGDPLDSDTDNLPDAWELRFAADLTVLTAGGDADSDGLSNADEYAKGTKPNDNDTDDDGALDGVETNTGVWGGVASRGTNPLIPDTDGDGLLDGVETNTGAYTSQTDTGTNPLAADSDGDSFTDGVEVLFGGSNPTNNLSRPLRPGQLDLLAYWPFNDNTNPAAAVDVHRGHTGVMLTGTDSTPTAYTADGGGRTGQPGDRGVDFGSAGSNSTGIRIDAGQFINIAAGQNQVAVSYWQKLYTVTDSVAFKGMSASSAGRGMSAHSTWSNNRFYFDTAGCCDGATQRIDVDKGTLDLVNQWHHIVFNKNGNTKEIWVDGVLLLSGTNTLPLPLDFTTFYIGKDEGAANTAAVFDDFAIFADALTPAQIQLLATGTAPNSPTLVPPNADADGDGMQDAYEDANGLNKNLDDRLLDRDSDGVNNITEYVNGTFPNNPDSDADGLTDGLETKTGVWASASNRGTDPLKPDSDGDGLGDAAETNTGTFVSLTNTGTNPNLADTDGDKWPDLTEIQWPTNASLATSFPAVNPNPAVLDLLAFWDFEDTSNPAASADCLHGFNASFIGTTGFSAPGTGLRGSRALNPGTDGGNNGAHVEGAKWFGLNVPPGKTVRNLGSIGADADLPAGQVIFDQPGALTGSGDTAASFPTILTARTPYLPALNPSGAWTVEAWLRPAAANPAGTLTSALSCGDFASPRKGWLIYQSDTGWNLRTYYNDGLATAVNITGNNGSAPAAGVWTHVVATWDGTVARLYVDGVLRVTSDTKPYVAGISGGFAVGSRADGGFGWNGDADEVAFYGAALSDTVIQSHYANGTNATPPQTYDTLVLASNPLAYWRMTDSAPGPLASDQVAVSYWQNLSSISNSSAFWASSPSSSGNLRGFQAHVTWGDNNLVFDTAGCCTGDTQRLVVPQLTGGSVGQVEMAPGMWQHFVFQKNGSRKEVWRDGLLILSGDAADRLPSDFTRLTIGAEPSGNGAANATRGLIDEFAVFGDYLTEAQIHQLALGLTPKSLASGGTVPVPELSLIDYAYDTANGRITLRWNSKTDKTYTVEASSNLNEQPWPIVIDSAVPTGGLRTTYVIDTATIPGGLPSRLYFRARQN